jgi:hypothetical protein
MTRSSANNDHDPTDIATCDGCGIREHIDLLDAKPDDPSNPEGCDWNRLECIRCYGPGWDVLSDIDDITKSVASELAPYYLGWLLTWLASPEYKASLSRGADEVGA